MATLVLTAVGGLVGGPPGAAIGAMLGQQVDGRILGGAKRREGPRLTELAVQTSSYGTAIPRLYGRMRVAGTVIWSTDLQETRRSARGGKGQPATTSYSYAASFAVLLSARRIAGVRRIWADGKLLRGAGGDWKMPTGFRLHLGDGDQSPDPLIAAAEGADHTPAHRGHAYAVFEQMQLADFGNRIPSLTFEVVADPDPVAIGAIVADLASDVDCSKAGLVVGFAATGGSVRAVCETLAVADGAWFAPDRGRIAMRSGTGDAIEIDDPGVAAADPKRRGDRTIAPVDTVPRSVTVAHYDPDRDYQRGTQRARRPAPGERSEEVEMPAVLAASAAAALAEAVLTRREIERVTRTVAGRLSAMARVPGERVSIAGEAGQWRITDVAVENMIPTLSLTPIMSASQEVRPASSGRVLGAADLVAGPTWIELFEMLALDDAPLSMPRLLVAAAGRSSGWRQAALLLSTDDGTSFSPIGATAAAAVLGSTVTMLAPGQPYVVDTALFVEVELAAAAMSLGDADPAAIDRGVNLALIGDELIQFARAEPLGGRRWRLSRLLRGRRATGAGPHAPGARFVLIERDSVRAVDLPLETIGRRVRVIAAGVGDGEVGTEQSCEITGTSVRPIAPVQLRRRRTDGDGWRIEWTRRSRAGWRWIDGADAPLAEEQESYRVDLANRRIDSTVPWIDLADDDPGVREPVTVRQRGTYGESPPTILAPPDQ